ncbi:hypothetical protein CEXT_741941 [Caerostris extrusa]|uniref:Uncharacterized protein n=1 Tax=Caerostris extrusa TaxID=172846 RepID=A0AAV4YC69_CAEEX|nr:hypothetical protein CEXT_741941 [Caerostris extrusa]
MIQNTANQDEFIQKNAILCKRHPCKLEIYRIHVKSNTISSLAKKIRHGERSKINLVVSVISLSERNNGTAEQLVRQKTKSPEVLRRRGRIVNCVFPERWTSREYLGFAMA